MQFPDENKALNEEQLPEWLPASVKQHLSYKLDDFRDSAKTYVRQEGWKKPSNAKEIENAYRKVWGVFEDSTLQDLWNKLDKEGIAIDFCQYLTHRIPSKFYASQNIKKMRNDKNKGIKEFKSAIVKLKTANSLVFHIASNQYLLAEKSITTLESELEKLIEKARDDLESDWLNNKLYVCKSTGLWPSSRQINESAFYQVSLYYWFSEKLGRPHEKEIATIVNTVLPDLDQVVDTTNVSGNTKALRKVLNNSSKTQP